MSELISTSQQVQRYDVAACGRPCVYVLHENDTWMEPLVRALQAQGIPYRSWFVHEGVLDLSVTPPPGVFYNRMSASSHTRGHRYAPELCVSVLQWLEQHGRVVLNGSAAARLEIDKTAQLTSLAARGVRTPKTVAAVGEAAWIAAAESFPGRFITKHNRAGKGLGVQLFADAAALRRAVEAGRVESSIDGVMLLQEYIEAPDGYITRMEFVGGKFMYAVRVDTRHGFELCPADSCQIGDAFCPTTQQQGEGRPRFEVLGNFACDDFAAYLELMQQHDIHVAAFEHIVDAEGRAYTYDINTNTNYNRAAERRAGSVCGMSELARYLGEQLQRAYPSVKLHAPRVQVAVAAQ